MKPASFEYYAPTSVEEALSIIAEVGDDGGKVLAGGQSLGTRHEFSHGTTHSPC